VDSSKVFKDVIIFRKWTPTVLQLQQYAEASKDYNPIHLDDKYAKKVGLGGVIAHGMLTMAQLGVMLTEWIQENGFIKEFEVNFKEMVRPGDTIHMVGRIKEVMKDTVRLEIEAQNQEGIRVVSGSAEVENSHWTSFSDYSDQF
jgi:acyl dehydratase